MRSRVYAFLGDESGDLASEGCDVVFSLLLSDLNLAFAEDLCVIIIIKTRQLGPTKE